MDDNKVCDLVEMLQRSKQVYCKWVFKTKCDYKGNIERYNVKLNTKGFTPRINIDYNETFSPVQRMIL